MSVTPITINAYNQEDIYVLKKTFDLVKKGVWLIVGNLYWYTGTLGKSPPVAVMYLGHTSSNLEYFPNMRQLWFLQGDNVFSIYDWATTMHLEPV